MNIKIVLTCLPYFNHVYTPPIQLAYLKAYLQQDKDIEVKAIDMETRCFHSSVIGQRPILYWNKMWSKDFDIKNEEAKLLDEFVDIILSEKPSVVGFSAAFSNFSFTRYVSQKIKKSNPKIYIVYGGRYFCLRDCLRHSIKEWHKGFQDVDCIVKNEGESALMELVQALKKEAMPKFCKGTTIRDGERIIDCGNRPLIENLDAIPFPDFSDFPREDYLEDYTKILFSRGCIGQCVYCVENDTMGSNRSRSAQNVLKEIKLRISQGYRRFQLCDLCLNSDLARLLEICDLIIQENLDIEFTFGEFRNAANLKPSAFRLLSKAGFKAICFGTESGSQLILNKMKKGVKVETIDNNLKDAHNAGLKVMPFLMVGFPGETEETFSETIEMLKRNKRFIDGIAAIAPTDICGGSRIHDNLNIYNLNTATLFKNPDVWESKDGKNNIGWRKALREKMIQRLRDFEIPLVDFISDGNPRIPLDRSITSDIEKIKEYKKKIPIRRESEKALLRFQYAARLIMREKYSNGSENLFLIEVINIANKEWRQIPFDWIRVGCKVYDEAQSVILPMKELRQDIPRYIKRGERFQAVFRMENGFLPKGRRCRLKFDMVNEFQFWFEDVGSEPLILNID